MKDKYLERLKWIGSRNLGSNPKSNFPNEHPFKKEIRKRGIRLWQLRNLTGYSEARLGRFLNGIDPMPYDIERLLRTLLYM